MRIYDKNYPQNICFLDWDTLGFLVKLNLFWLQPPTWNNHIQRNWKGFEGCFLNQFSDKFFSSKRQTLQVLMCGFFRKSQEILSSCVCWHEWFVSSFWRSEHHNTVWCGLRLVFGRHRFIIQSSTSQINHTCIHCASLKQLCVGAVTIVFWMKSPIKLNWSLFGIFNSNYLAT